MTRETKTTDKQAGQGFVEFALILPVLLLLMWGVIEFGRLLFIYTEVSNAAREAVRFGVVRGTDLTGPANYRMCEEIEQAGAAVTALTPLLDEANATWDIGYDHGGGDIFSLCPPTADVSSGDRLVVNITYDVRPLVLFQDAGPFVISFTAARTIVQDGLPLGVR